MFDNPIGPPWGVIGQVAVVTGLLVVSYFYTTNVNSQSLPPNEETVFCTMDAKLCPDGTSVGRVGPNCEFAPCPGN